MSDNVGLTLILRNTEEAARDSRAAMEATQRLIESFGPRFSAVEARISALEQRSAGIERAIDEMARVTHRTQQMVASILSKVADAP